MDRVIVVVAVATVGGDRDRHHQHEADHGKDRDESTNRHAAPHSFGATRQEVQWRASRTGE
jgi:hypothetical protein